MIRLVLLGALLPATLTLPAQAAGTLVRTFVSAAGLDTNPCTVTAPCRTFVAAYAAALPNGIIAALDPAGYGPLTIDHGITIDGNDFAAITAPTSGAGITVNAGTSDKVYLRGLTIDGQNQTGMGITFNTGQSLTVDDCTARDLFYGLYVNAGAVAADITVTNSRFNGNTAGMEMFANGAGNVTISVDRTVLTNNGFGLVAGTFAAGTMTVAVTNSVSSYAGEFGFLIESVLTTAAANLSVTNCQVTGNGAGLRSATANTTLWVAQSTVTGNALGYDAESGGVINSYGNNFFAANAGNTGTLTPVLPQ